MFTPQVNQSVYSYFVKMNKKEHNMPFFAITKKGLRMKRSVQTNLSKKEDNSQGTCTRWSYL